MTARLSQKFYERFGDDLTNELVDWMNQVDAGYRTEFRELFELNFGRFETRLQHGLDELRAELRAEFRESLSGMRGEVHESLTGMRGQLHDETGGVRQSLMDEIGRVRESVVEMKGDLRQAIEAARADTLKWNIIMWVGAVGTMVALVKL